MTVEETRILARINAEKIVAALNASKDPHVVYKTSRPVIDIRDMFRSSVALYGDHTAFMQRFEKGQPFRSITYREALEDVNALGTALVARGLKDARIALIGENCYQWALSYLAVLCGVGVVVPLDKELGPGELGQLIREAEADAVLFTRKYEDLFCRMAGEEGSRLKTLVKINGGKETADGVLDLEDLLEEGRALLAQGDRRYLDAEIDPEAMNVLLFTSGTTGIAKGVMLCQRNLADDLMRAPTLLNVNDWDIFFSVLPLHHTYECTCGFLMPLYKGAAIAYCEGLKYLQKNLQEVRPTMFLAVPLIFENLYKAIWKNIRKQGKEESVRRVMAFAKKTGPLGKKLQRHLLKDIYKLFGDRMRVLISGGAAISPEILEFFNDLGYIAVQGYGLTECAPMAALNPDDHKTMRADSVGHLLPGLEAKILDADGDGVGEICIKGPNVMMGYYNMPEETEKALEDGWFHTGDLGYIDQGDFIYITGRAKNVIITPNGKNVFPEELEYYLAQCPFVAESMVWAEKAEDSRDGQIVATIYPDKEAVREALGQVPGPEDLQKLLWEKVDGINDQLPPFKRIGRIVVRSEEFEKTTGKKIKRFVASNKN